MRIVQLITQTRGGPVDHAVGVAVELATLGHESHLVGPAGEYAARLAGTGVSWHRSAVAHSHDVVGARGVAETLSRIRPDLLHCQDRRAGLVGRLYAWRSRTPSVYTLHGVPDGLAHLVAGNLAVASATRSTRLGNLTAERWLARVPRSMVVTPCEAVARYAREQVGVPADRVRSVPNGVAPSWIGQPPLRGADLNTPVTAAWLGVMQPVKRLPALVRATADVVDLRLLLIGDGPERARVERAIARSGRPDHVQLTGFRADPRAALDGADIFVLPSAAEACPMAVLQAMACGLPVIASRAGGIPEVVRDGIDGLLVDTGDDDGLRVALRVLCTDPAMRQELGDNARRRVRDCFTVAHCTHALLEIYRALQDDRSSTGRDRRRS